MFRSQQRRLKINWKVAGFCIAAATIFWFLNAMNKKYTTSLSYPIEFNYPADKMIATGPTKTEIDINVSGDGWNLFKKSLGIGIDPITISLESLSKKSYLSTSFLQEINQNLDDLQINYVYRDTLKVNLDYRDHKIVYLKPGSIETIENTVVKRVTLTPDSIVFEGASENLKKLRDTITIKFSDPAGETYTTSQKIKEITNYDEDRITPNIESFEIKVETEKLKKLNLQFETYHFLPDNMIDSKHAIDSTFQISLKTTQGRLDSARQESSYDFTFTFFSDEKKVIPNVTKSPSFVEILSIDTLDITKK